MAGFVISDEDLSQIEGFLAEFEEDVAQRLRACRVVLQERFPTAYELVYDNYNFLVFGYCASRRPSTGIVSLTGAANGTALAFLQGATLADPDGLLRGDGKVTRSMKVPEVGVLADPRVVALLDAAESHGPLPMPLDGAGRTIVVSVSPHRRPRRPGIVE